MIVPTLDDVRKYAEYYGYRLVKKEPLPIIEACSCGNKHPVMWKGPGYKYYRCQKCGHRGGKAKTDRKAIEKWNQSLKPDWEDEWALFE